MTVALHSILCFRGVYPASVFSRKQSYSVPVWASRHPGLNEYIDDIIAAARVQILKVRHLLRHEYAESDAAHLAAKRASLPYRALVARDAEHP